MLEVQDQSAGMVDFSLYPHMVEGARALCGVSFVRALTPFMRAPPS